MWLDPRQALLLVELRAYMKSLIFPMFFRFGARYLSVVSFERRLFVYLADGFSMENSSGYLFRYS